MSHIFTRYAQRENQDAAILGKVSLPIVETLCGEIRLPSIIMRLLSPYARSLAPFTVKDFLATLKTRGLYNYCITQTTTENPNEENKKANASRKKA